MSPSQVTNRLRAWREDAGLSLRECADLIGFSVAMLSHAERGERAFSPEAKVRIARRLGVRIAEIFPVDEDEADPPA